MRYDTLAGAEAVLNTDLYNEDISVQVCHADTGSVERTYTVHVQKSDPIQLTIQTTPADATVFLTNDLNGKRIVEKNGTYSLTPVPAIPIPPPAPVILARRWSITPPPTRTAR